MRRQNKLRLQRRRHRKFYWLFSAAAISALLFGDQVALLYVLWILATVALLMVAAFSNLKAKDAELPAAAIRNAVDYRRTNSWGFERGVRSAA